MPLHDWTRVDAGIFHAFHHEWIFEIGRATPEVCVPLPLEPTYQAAWTALPAYWQAVIEGRAAR